MRRIIVLVLICLVMTIVSRHGQAQVPPAARMDAMPPTAFRSDAINVLDYGVRCDGVTDDAAAINAAADAWRTEHGAQRGARLLFPSRGVCLIRGPINLTNVFSRGALVDGNGVVILCETGSLCIDATGVTGLDISNIVLRGSRRNTPRIGIQWAREGLRYGCSEDNARNLVITGDFSFADIYIEACEDMSWTDSYIENEDKSAAAWLVVEDGLNDWNAQSPFQPITIGHKPHGMDELVWTNPIFFQKGPGHMMWLANSHSTELIGEAYGNSDFGAAPFVLAHPPHTNNGNLIVDMHFEENHQQSVFELDGPDPSPVINGLVWHERGSQPVGAIFARGPGVRTARLEDVDLKVDQYYGTHAPLPKMFDDPAAWSVSGDVFLPTLAWWNQPAHWTGCITTLTSARECSLGSVTALTASAPVENLAFAASGDNAYDITVSAPLRLTLSGGAAGQAQRLTLVLRQGPASAGLVTLPGNVTWVGHGSGLADPVVSGDAVITFLTVDGGRTYFGYIN
jgi:hypothetical protein